MSKLRPEEHKEKAKVFLKTRTRGTEKTSDFNKEYDLLRHFGITLEYYNALLVEQNGVCAICGNLESIIDNRTKRPRQLAVDHCHKTHKVRGLLCMGCNQGIGNFRENVDYMAKAISYIVTHNGP